MSNLKKTAAVEATHSLVLWTGLNNGGDGLEVNNGQAGILAADAGAWNYKSVGISAMQLFVWSAPDTATPGYSFSGHIESLLYENNRNLPLLYTGAEFPLQYVGIDPLEVGVLFVNVDSGDNPVALAFSQTYPNKTVPLTTFAAPGINGALGFFSLLSGSSHNVAVQYGDYSLTDGSVVWSGNGSLTIEWNGNTPAVTVVSGLPAIWQFGTPTKQADGSWLLTLTATGTAANTGTLFTEKGFTGSSEALLPHALRQLNSGIGWAYNSLKLSDMPTLIYSSFAPSNTNYVFSGYQEQLLTKDIDDFSAIFTGTPPVNLLTLDNTDVIIRVAIITKKDNNSAWIITQSYPQAFYTFASTSESGVLALLPASGSSQQISLSYGSLNASGLFTATGTTTLSAKMDDGTPVLTPGSDWPATLIFSAPTQENDGSWTVAIADSRVVLNPALYPRINYDGTPIELLEHQSVELRTLANLWQYDSLRVFGKHWLSSTLYDPQSSTYDYRKYRDNYSDTDVPNISKDYPLASAVINGVVLGDNDVVVQVQLEPKDANQNAVLSASQSWPLAFYTAATYLAGVKQQGVLIVFDKTQAVHTVPIKLGTLNADGSASWEHSTTVSARWDSNLAKPVLTLGQDAPADFQLSQVQSTNLAGEFTTVLSFDNGVVITMYALTNAPSSSQIAANQFTPSNKIVLYANRPVTVTLQLNKNAQFLSSGLKTKVLDLPALSMTTVEINDNVVEETTVTLTGENITTQSATLNFTTYPLQGYLSLAANSGAPANGGVENTVYLDTTNISYRTVHVTLSGSAVFADTNVNNKIFPLRLPGYDITFGIVNTVAETVTITAVAEDNSSLSTTSTFVKILTPVTTPLAVKMYAITNAPSTRDLSTPISYEPNNSVVLYSNKPVTATLQLTGGGQFRANDQATYVFTLPALSMTSIDIYNTFDTTVTVTLSANNINTQSTTLDFKKPTTSDRFQLSTTTGAPATRGVANRIYLQDKSSSDPYLDYITVTVSGSAVLFDSITGTILGNTYSYYGGDRQIEIVDSVTETTNISLEYSNGKTISTSATFVPV